MGLINFLIKWKNKFNGYLIKTLSTIYNVIVVNDKYNKIWNNFLKNGRERKKEVTLEKNTYDK